MDDVASILVSASPDAVINNSVIMNSDVLATSVTTTNQTIVRSASFVYLVVKHMGLCVVMTDNLKNVFHVRAAVQISLCVPGIVGALLSLRVSCLRKNRSSLSVQVALLSLYDLLYLCAVLLLSVLYLCDVSDRAANGVLLAVKMLSLWCVTYTLVDISVERCLAIDRPLLARKVCRVTFTLKRAGVILVAGVFLTLPFVLDLLFGFSTKQDECDPGQVNRSERRLTEYGVVYTLHIVLLLFYLFPFTVIIAVNAKLVYALAQMSRRHRELTGKGFHATSQVSSSGSCRSAVTPTTTQQVDSSARQLSGLVVGLSVWYAACMLSPSVLFLVRLSRVELLHPESDMVAAMAADCLVVASAAANFLFYFLLWRHFRQTFYAVFCKGRCHSSDLDHSSSYAMNTSRSQTHNNHAHNSGGTAASGLKKTGECTLSSSTFLTTAGGGVTSESETDG